MLYREFKNFRDIDLQVFDIYNVSDNYKKRHDRDLVEPLKCMFYITHDKGINITIFGDKYEEKIKEPITIGNEDNYENINFTRSKYKNEEMTEYLKELYYNDEDIIKTRENTLIDSFRHSDYPDDVEVMIPLEDGRMEQVWVRLKKVLSDTEFVGTMIHDSLDVEVLKQGINVKLVIYNNKKIETLILDSIYK